MRLETQLNHLAKIGLALPPGMTVEDVLTFDSREVFEQVPIGLLLPVRGLESQGKPWGRRMCDRAWTLNIKCVDGVGDEFHPPRSSRDARVLGTSPIRRHARVSVRPAPAPPARPPLRPRRRGMELAFDHEPSGGHVA